MTWEIDSAHTLVEFSVDHLMINVVKGRFNEVYGTLHLDTRQPENSWVKAAVNTASLSTGIVQRDEHLLSNEFFDAARFPTITFESIRVRRTGSKDGTISGNFTMHGITRTVSFKADFTGYARDPFSNRWKMGLSATGTIDRRMFDMHFGQVAEAGIALIGYETRIKLHIEAFQIE
jgi:polyisoprenoid-binding protein YceI